MSRSPAATLNEVAESGWAAHSLPWLMSASVHCSLLIVLGLCVSLSPTPVASGVSATGAASWSARSSVPRPATTTTTKGRRSKDSKVTRPARTPDAPAEPSDANLFEDVLARPFLRDQLGQQFGQGHLTPSGDLFQRVRNDRLRFVFAEVIGDLLQPVKGVFTILDHRSVRRCRGKGFWTRLCRASGWRRTAAGV